MNKLTTRERDILYLIAEGFTNREISKALFVSVYTVDTYRRRLFIKLGARNAANLVCRAFEKGILPNDRPESNNSNLITKTK